jgi:hypothetical protein
MVLAQSTIQKSNPGWRAILNISRGVTASV